MTPPTPAPRPSGSLDAPDTPGWRHLRAGFGLLCIVGGPVFFVVCTIFKVQDTHTWIIALLLIAVGVMGLFPLKTVGQALTMLKDFIVGIKDAIAGFFGKAPTGGN